MSEGVPPEVLERARRLVTKVVDGKVRLELYRTQAEMEAAVRRIDPRAPADFVARYHYRTRTIFAHLAPEGLLTGALVHEAHHARGHLSDKAYLKMPAWRREGETDRDTVLFLRDVDRTWEFWLESRIWRARRRGLFSPGFESHDPDRLPAAQRATWYAQAYAAAQPERMELEWVVYAGAARPREGSYDLVSWPGASAMLVRADEGPLDLRVRPLGQVELIFGFSSLDSYAKVVFGEGRARAMWRQDGAWSFDPLHPAPSLKAGGQLSLEDGVVRIDGRAVLYVQAPPGRRGLGVHDGSLSFGAR